MSPALTLTRLSLRYYRAPRSAFGAYGDFSRVRSLERILAERRNVL
jgi:hypothetical protein